MRSSAPGSHALEGGRDQRRRRAAVQRARVPRPARVLGRHEALAVGEEDASRHMRSRVSRGSRATKSASLPGSRSGAPWPKQVSRGRSSASRRAESRLRGGSGREDVRRLVQARDARS